MFYSGVITFDGVICPLETRSVNIEFVTFDGELNNGDVIKLFESPKHELERSSSVKINEKDYQSPKCSIPLT